MGSSRVVSPVWMVWAAALTAEAAVWLDALTAADHPLIAEVSANEACSWPTASCTTKSEPCRAEVSASKLICTSAGIRVSPLSLDACTITDRSKGQEVFSSQHAHRPQPSREHLRIVDALLGRRRPEARQGG